jgi:hypothetical protein
MLFYWLGLFLLHSPFFSSRTIRQLIAKIEYVTVAGLLRKICI